MSRLVVTGKPKEEGLNRVPSTNQVKERGSEVSVCHTHVRASAEIDFVGVGTPGIHVLVGTDLGPSSLNMHAMGGARWWSALRCCWALIVLAAWLPW